MSDISELFTKTLQNNGYSVTKARKAVFGALDSEEPLEMRKLIKKVGSKFDRASIYRTVSLFEKLGIIQRLQIGWKYKLELTDLFNYHHHHVTCISCGIIVPLREDSMLEATLNSLAREYGFQPRTHQLEIQGLCRNCQRANI